MSGAEIDLLIDRNDKAINIIEMKYVKGKFTIDGKYMDVLLSKASRLRDVTKTSKTIFITMSTSGGLSNNGYSQEIDRSFDMSILFE